jgi:vacuolar protein sorting-associated protein 45
VLKTQTGMVSLVFAQSELLNKDVYLFEKIDQEKREQMPHMRAIVFVRPTAENVRLLVRELRAPKYAEYSICRWW